MKKRKPANPLSYRRISLLLGVVGLLLLAGSLHICFQFYFREEPYYQSQRDALGTIDDVLSETRYALQVFDNIRQQLDRYPEMDGEKQQNLQTAYVDKRGQYQLLVDVLAETTGQMKQVLNAQLGRASLFMSGSDSQLLRPLIGDLEKSVAELRASSGQALPEPGQMRNLDVSSLWTIQTRFEKELGALDGKLSHLADLHNSRFYRYVEYSIGFLSLLLLVLAFLLRRMLRVGIHMAEASFSLLARHDYNPEGILQIRAFFEEEARMLQQATGFIEEQGFLEEVKQAAGRGYVIEEVLENIYRHVHARMPINYMEILSIDAKKGSARTEALSNGKLAPEEIRNLSFSLTEKHFARCMEAGHEIVMTDIAHLHRPSHNQLEETSEPDGGDGRHLDLLYADGVRAVVVMPLFLQGFMYAFLVFGAAPDTEFGPDEILLCRNIAGELSSLLEKTLLTKTMFNKLTTSFAELVDRKDNETGDHLNRMVGYSTLLAKKLLTHPDPEYRLNPQVVRDIKNNAAIHDIGKVAIPDSILKKPGRLDEQEWRIMKTHAAVGADILREIRDELRIFRQNFYEVAENIARYHHEKWDGTGYPEGLAGCDIPLEARIVAVADVFDALSSPRVYKPAWPLEAAFSELQAIAGTHLDPELVKIFLSSKRDIQKVAQPND
jgi:HD-GYP domain-containing protein (c-di-GMP phosphodiesterase class II)